MDPSYEFIDHTADVLFKAKAATLEQLFEQCGLALEDTQVELKGIEQKEQREFNLEEKHLDRLLFDFLDELLLYKDSELLLFSKFDLKINKENDVYKLHCTAIGEKLDRQRHEEKVDVKAITMHMFEVTQDENGHWTAQVLVDI